ncbi:MAG: hypothetical protein ACYS26_12905 [Planctomycetota bacterium]|jgi:hypothetical protein
MLRLSLFLTAALALLTLGFTHPVSAAPFAQAGAESAALIAQDGPGEPFTVDDQEHTHSVLGTDETRWSGKVKVTNSGKGKVRVIVRNGGGVELSNTIINAKASDTINFPKGSSVEIRQVGSGTSASGFYEFL